MRLVPLLIGQGAVKVETQVYGAWTTHGPDEIIKRAFELQRREGWDPVRKALALTVRLVTLPPYMNCIQLMEITPAASF